MNNQIGVEQLEKTLDRVHEWIRAADQKISIFLAFNGIIITLLAIPVLSWVKHNSLCFDLVAIFLLNLSLTFLIYGLLKTFFALSPVLRQKQGDSFTYFGDVARLKFEEYKNRINRLTQPAYKNELIKQIHISSKIAKQKHTHFKDALWLFVLGMVLLLSTVIYFNHQYGF